MTKKTTATQRKVAKSSTKTSSNRAKARSPQVQEEKTLRPERQRKATQPFTLTQLYPATISDDELSHLPIAKCPVPLHVIDTKLDARKAVAKIRRASCVGIDTETRPSFKAGVRYDVSLLQIATDEECFLFRLNTIGLTKSLIGLLEDP